MVIDRFENIIAWQKSKVLCVEVYRLLSNHRDFGFRDQILRASVSVMNNIAEGFERKTNKEFIFSYTLQKDLVEKLDQC